MTKKMLLVNPKSDNTGNMQYINYLTGNKRGLLNVSLPTIAALTPSEFDLTIIDEVVEDINFNIHYDMEYHPLLKAIQFQYLPQNTDGLIYLSSLQYLAKEYE